MQGPSNARVILLRALSRRASVPFIVGILLLGGACSGGDKQKPLAESPSTSASAPGSEPAATPSPNPRGAPAGVPTRSPAPSVSPTPRPKTIAFGNITFHAPADWDIDVEGDTAFVGVLAGGPDDVMLRVQRNFAGSIDSLKPAGCPREGDPPEPAVSVQTVESGLRPVGSRKAEYRLWRVTCATVRTREHRAWLLPTSKIAIVEQVHEGHPENVDVVTTAEVR
jgi:hypothetical protein